MSEKSLFRAGTVNGQRITGMVTSRVPGPVADRAGQAMRQAATVPGVVTGTARRLVALARARRMLALGAAGLAAAGAATAVAFGARRRRR